MNAYAGDFFPSGAWRKVQDARTTEVKDMMDNFHQRFAHMTYYEKIKWDTGKIGRALEIASKRFNKLLAQERPEIFAESV